MNNKESVKEIIDKYLWCLKNCKYSLKEEGDVFTINTFEDKELIINIILNKGLSKLKSKYKIEVDYNGNLLNIDSDYLISFMILNLSEKIMESWVEYPYKTLDAISLYVLDKMNIKRKLVKKINYVCRHGTFSELPKYNTTRINKYEYEIKINENSKILVSENVNSKRNELTLIKDGKKRVTSYFEYNNLNKEFKFKDNQDDPDYFINYCLNDLIIEKEIFQEESFLLSEEEFGQNEINSFNLLAIDFIKNTKTSNKMDLPKINTKIKDLKKEIVFLNDNLIKMKDILDRLPNDNVKGILLDNYVRCKHILENKEDEMNELKVVYLEHSSNLLTEKLKKVV